VECDSASSLITEVEAGHGISLASPSFKLVAGKRLLYRALTGTTEMGSVGIARATKGDVTPAGEKFCEILRKTSDGVGCGKTKAARVLLNTKVVPQPLHQKSSAGFRRISPRRVSRPFVARAMPTDPISVVPVSAR